MTRATTTSGNWCARRLAAITGTPVLHARAVGGASAGEPRSSGNIGTITGLAVPYNRPSADLGGFREVYAPGCFSKSIAQDDIRALYEHQPQMILGRKSAGTLELREDAAGVHIEIDVPDTTFGSDLLKSMRRGDLDGLSACFFILARKWEMRGSRRVRVIERGQLLEVSVVGWPAYPGAKASSDSGAVDSTEAAVAARVHELPMATLLGRPLGERADSGERAVKKLAGGEVERLVKLQFSMGGYDVD